MCSKDFNVLNRLVAVKECDATKADSSTAVQYINKNLIVDKQLSLVKLL